MSQTVSSPLYAAIDLGSNSFHMLVVRHIDGSVQTMAKIKRKVRLAAGLDENNTLSSEAMQRGWDCLSLFAERLQDIPEGNIRIVGTATLRTATNVDVFLEKANQILGHKVEHLDGDLVRKMFPGTGFTREERDKHIKRVGYLAAMLEKHEVFVVASFISPYRERRAKSRQEIGEFIEVYVECPVEECARRDVKGLYAKAFTGEIVNFTGVSDPYEEPENPEIVCRTAQETLEESVAKVITYLEKRGYIPAA